MPGPGPPAIRLTNEHDRNTEGKADPFAYLISSADGPVAGDEDIDVVRRALEQTQRGEVVLDRIRGVVQVEHRNQDIGKHVASDENPAFLNQQRRMARGMRLMRGAAPSPRARAGDLNADAWKTLPQPAGPTCEGRSRGRPFRRRASQGQ